MSELPNSFPDPYESLPSEQQHRTSIVTDKKVWSAINSCRGHRGTLQTTINILLRKLHEQLESNGIVSFDPRRYEHAILKCRLVLGGTGETEPFVPPKAVNRNDGRGTPGMVHDDSRRSDESTDLSRAPTHWHGEENNPVQS